MEYFTALCKKREKICWGEINDVSLQAEQWTCSIYGIGVSPIGRVVRFVAALFFLFYGWG